MERITKSIMVATSVSKIEGRKVTFNLTLPSYFSKQVQNESDEFLKKLQHQMLGGDVKIMGLSLTWSEDK